jgi:intracellular sulfur oxidation DsrE/DsrF family protein
VDPQAKITVVTHALGVDFLLEGVKDVNGSPFAGPGGGAQGRVA